MNVDTLSMREGEKGGSTTVKKKEQGSIALFQGVTPNLGTTVVSFATACMLSEVLDRSVAYVCLNLKSSKLHHYSGISQPQASLDGIRAEIKSRSLTPELLAGWCEKLPGAGRLHVLFGNLLREQAEYYMPEDIVHLLETSRRTFDLTIVEVSAYWDNAATLVAVEEADSHTLVCEDRLGSFQEDYARWHARLTPLFGMTKDDSQLFVIRRGAGGYTLGDIGKQTGLPVVGKLRCDDHVAAMLDQGDIVDLALNYGPLRAQLKQVVSSLVVRHHFSERQVPAKRKLLRRWMPV